MSILQLGIDLGRVIAHSEHDKNPDTLRAAAQSIIDTLGLSLIIDEEPSLVLGLGYGLSDRHKTPLEDAALGIMGITG